MSTALEAASTVVTPMAAPTSAAPKSTNTGGSRPTLKASQKSLAIAKTQADDPVWAPGLTEAESPEEEPYRPVYLSTGGSDPGTSTPKEKWKIMGSRRFVEVFGIEAIRRLGVHDPLFEYEVRTERDNAVRSSSARAKERIFKL